MESASNLKRLLKKNLALYTKNWKSFKYPPILTLLKRLEDYSRTLDRLIMFLMRERLSWPTSQEKFCWSMFGPLGAGLARNP